MGSNIIAIRCNDSRGLGWLAAKEGDVLAADGWECSSDRPDACGRGLYGWQIHPQPNHAQGDGWSGRHVTDAEWVAWEAVDPERTAVLTGKVATYQAKIVRSASDPIGMLAWIRAQGYHAPCDLETAAGALVRARWGWMTRLAAILTHEVVYRHAVANGWPIDREQYTEIMRYTPPDAAPVEWSYPLASAVECGGWTSDGRPVPGVAQVDAEAALHAGITVDAALLARLVRAWGKVVRAHEIRRAIGVGHAGAEREVKALHAARLAARLGKCRAVDLSYKAEGALRPAERGEVSARTERRTIAVWYRGAIMGWVTPYRAECLGGTLTTIAALRAGVKRRVQVPNYRYARSIGAGQSVGDELVKRANRVIGRRGWITERYQSSSGGWGRSADYSMRCVDPVTGAVVAAWGYGTSPTVEAAITIIDADRVMRAKAGRRKS